MDEVKQNVDNQMENILEKVIKEIPREKYNELGEEDTDGEWVKVRPEDYDDNDRERVKRVQSLQERDSGLIGHITVGSKSQSQASQGDTHASSNTPAEDSRKDKRKHKGRKLRVSTGRKVSVRKERPEVITVVEKGVYEINLKSLLENSPIIIQKDGSYLIHLPSLFENMKKDET